MAGFPSSWMPQSAGPLHGLGDAGSPYVEQLHQSAGGAGGMLPDPLTAAAMAAAASAVGNGFPQGFPPDPLQHMAMLQHVIHAQAHANVHQYATAMAAGQAVGRAGPHGDTHPPDGFPGFTNQAAHQPNLGCEGLPWSGLMPTPAGPAGIPSDLIAAGSRFGPGQAPGAGMPGPLPGADMASALALSNAAAMMANPFTLAAAFMGGLQGIASALQPALPGTGLQPALDPVPSRSTLQRGMHGSTGNLARGPSIQAGLFDGRVPSQNTDFVSGLGRTDSLTGMQALPGGQAYSTQQANSSAGALSSLIGAEQQGALLQPGMHMFGPPGNGPVVPHGVPGLAPGMPGTAAAAAAAFSQALHAQQAVLAAGLLGGSRLGAPPMLGPPAFDHPASLVGSPLPSFLGMGSHVPGGNSTASLLNHNGPGGGVSSHQDVPSGGGGSASGLLCAGGGALGCSGRDLDCSSSPAVQTMHGGTAQLPGQGQQQPLQKGVLSRRLKLRSSTSSRSVCRGTMGQGMPGPYPPVPAAPGSDHTVPASQHARAGTGPAPLPPALGTVVGGPTGASEPGDGGEDSDGEDTEVSSERDTSHGDDNMSTAQGQDDNHAEEDDEVPLGDAPAAAAVGAPPRDAHAPTSMPHPGHHQHHHSAMLPSLGAPGLAPPPGMPYMPSMHVMPPHASLMAPQPPLPPVSLGTPAGIASMGSMPSSSMHMPSGRPMSEREAKIEKRKQSNRDSARRSRLRKQEEMEHVSDRLAELESGNPDLTQSVTALSEAADYLELCNAVLRGLLDTAQQHAAAAGSASTLPEPQVRPFVEKLAALEAQAKPSALAALTNWRRSMAGGAGGGQAALTAAQVAVSRGPSQEPARSRDPSPCAGTAYDASGVQTHGSGGPGLRNTAPGAGGQPETVGSARTGGLRGIRSPDDGPGGGLGPPSSYPWGVAGTGATAGTRGSGTGAGTATSCRARRGPPTAPLSLPVPPPAPVALPAGVQERDEAGEALLVTGTSLGWEANDPQFTGVPAPHPSSQPAVEQPRGPPGACEPVPVGPFAAPAACVFAPTAATAALVMQPQGMRLAAADVVGRQKAAAAAELLARAQAAARGRSTHRTGRDAAPGDSNTHGAGGPHLAPASPSTTTHPSSPCTQCSGEDDDGPGPSREAPAVGHFRDARYLAPACGTAPLPVADGAQGAAAQGGGLRPRLLSASEPLSPARATSLDLAADWSAAVAAPLAHNDFQDGGSSPQLLDTYFRPISTQPVAAVVAAPPSRLGRGHAGPTGAPTPGGEGGLAPAAGTGPVRRGPASHRIHSGSCSSRDGSEGRGGSKRRRSGHAGTGGDGTGDGSESEGETLAAQSGGALEQSSPPHRGGGSRAGDGQSGSCGPPGAGASRHGVAVPTPTSGGRAAKQRKLTGGGHAGGSTGGTVGSTPPAQCHGADGDQDDSSGLAPGGSAGGGGAGGSGGGSGDAAAGALPPLPCTRNNKLDLSRGGAPGGSGSDDLEGSKDGGVLGPLGAADGAGNNSSSEIDWSHMLQDSSARNGGNGNGCGVYTSHLVPSYAADLGTSLGGAVGPSSITEGAPGSARAEGGVRMGSGSIPGAGLPMSPNQAASARPAAQEAGGLAHPR